MIVTDVNVLVYAYRAETAHHDRSARWLSAALAGQEDIGLLDVVISGLMRIVTSPRVFAEPAPTAHAASFIGRIIDAPRSRWLPTGQPTWDAFVRLASGDGQVRGNLVPDAYIAAAALSNNGRVATVDRGFARFPGLRLLDPTVD